MLYCQLFLAAKSPEGIVIVDKQTRTDILKSCISNYDNSIPYIVKPLAHICNTSVMNGIFPDRMKIARVIPLFKNGDVKEFSNYRSVSILPQFSKILEKVFHNRLMSFINDKQILNNSQFGFRPAMLYGLETVALTKRQEAEMEVAELKMLRFSLGVTRMDKIRNEYIRGTAQVGKFGEKTREARLRWYGHLRRKDDGYIGRRMLRMELPGKRKRGRPKRRFMDVVKEDMAEVEVTEEDTVDRRNWRKKIRCGDP